MSSGPRKPRHAQGWGWGPRGGEQGPRTPGAEGQTCPPKEKWPEGLWGILGAGTGLQVGHSPGQPGQAELRGTVVRDVPVPGSRPPPHSGPSGTFWVLPCLGIWAQGAGVWDTLRALVGTRGEELSRKADCLLTSEVGAWVAPMVSGLRGPRRSPHGGRRAPQLSPPCSAHPRIRRGRGGWRSLPGRPPRGDN